MVNKSEFIWIALSVVAMAGALFLLRADTVSLSTITEQAGEQPAVAVVGDADTNNTGTRARTVADSLDESAQLRNLVIDDITVGSGPTVSTGDTVTVHYRGQFETGRTFDSSYDAGEPFTFTVGAGRVIEGWEQGIIGMQPGGTRVLVIPSELGYGSEGFGPIPGNATLVFTVELLSID